MVAPSRSPRAPADASSRAALPGTRPRAARGCATPGRPAAVWRAALLPAVLLFAAGGRGAAQDAADLMAQLQALLGDELGAAAAEGLQAGASGAPASAPAPAPLPPATPLGVGDNTGFDLLPNDLLEFHARNLSVAEAFAQLRQLVRRNIVVAPGVEARFTGDLYNLGVEEIVDVIAASTGLVARIEEDVIYLEPAELLTRVFPLHHARASDLVAILTPMLSEEGFVSGTLPAQQGITASQEFTGGDDYAQSEVLVVREYPDLMRHIETLVERMDAAPPQVVVEATILTAELLEGMEAGVSFTALSGADFGDVAGSSDDGTSVEVGPYGSALLDDGVGTATSALADAISQAGLNVGVFKDGVGVFLRAVESITETEVLANTKLVTVNKQRGEVLLGRRDGYRTSTTTQTSTTEEIEFLETGTRLVYRPYVLKDGWVRMEVHPEDSDGGLTDDGLPFEETAEVTTNVMVRHGETIVIGGLFRDRNREFESKIPWLGDLPFLGWLFRSTIEERQTEEIIVLLTPRIQDPATLPPATAGTALGDAPLDPARLADAWLDGAQALVDRRLFGSAAVLLRSAESLGHHPADVEALSTALWQRYLPDFAGSAVDRQILRQVLAATGSG